MAMEFDLKKTNGTESKPHRRPRLHKHHFNLLFLMVIFLIIVVIVLIQPAFVGYKLSKQFEDMDLSAADIVRNLDNMKNKIAICNTNLESYEKANAECLKDLANEQNTSFAYLRKSQELEAEVKRNKLAFEFNLTQTKAKLNSQLEICESQLQNKITETEANLALYDEVIAESARSICCKEKVDDNSIDSYIISGGSIVCTSGKEYKIDC